MVTTGKCAVILAGGKGTRLRPYTTVLPKPLMPIGDYPILEVIIRQLRRDGFDHVIMAVNHQAELIRAFFGDGAKWGISISYSMEDRPLSTMGPLKLIQNLPENFLIMNGDVLTDLAYGAFFNLHASKRNLFTIGAYRRQVKVDFGVLHISSNGILEGFEEKPDLNYFVSMGVYMANREILSLIPDGRPYGFDELMLRMIEVKKPPAVHLHEGYWLDIGRPDDYAQAIEKFGAKEKDFLG